MIFLILDHFVFGVKNNPERAHNLFRNCRKMKSEVVNFYQRATYIQAGMARIIARGSCALVYANWKRWKE